MNTLLAHISAVFADCLAAFHATPQDPKRLAEDPPAFWHKPAPTAKVPPRNSRSNVVELDTSLYTEEEIMAMTDDDFRQKIGCLGLQTREQAIKGMTKKRIGSAKEIDL